ncbi:MAG TPA: META domain-containing protein [Allosphingosinicella sp.]
MRSTIVITALALLGSTGAGAQEHGTRSGDPLAGSWRPVRLGTVAVPAAAEARLVFSGGGEYSTQAGCGNFGGFYRLYGHRIQVRQRDPVQTGKCPSRSAARLETALAGFMAQAAAYELLPGGGLRIVAGDGSVGLFRRPAHVIPALAGPWLVERIGGDTVPWSRNARLNFEENRVTASARCNSYGARIRPVGSGFLVAEGAATQMGCDPDRQAFDARLFTAVEKARRWVKLPNARIRLEGAGEPLLLTRPPTLR